MKKIVSYFLQGVLYTVPITVTGFVIYKIFILIDGIIPFQVPGLGLVVILFLLTMLGYLGSSIIGNPISAYFERLVSKAPLVKIIYSAVQDLLQAFVGKKKSFDKPVLVQLEKESDVRKLGFITQEDLQELGIEEGMVAVYLPHSYAWSGNQFIVPSQNVTPLDVSAATVMKFVISGGVTKIDDKANDKIEKE